MKRAAFGEWEDIMHSHGPDFQSQVRCNWGGGEVSFAPTVIYSLARNLISCVRLEML